MKVFTRKFARAACALLTQDCDGRGGSMVKRTIAPTCRMSAVPPTWHRGKL